MPIELIVLVVLAWYAMIFIETYSVKILLYCFVVWMYLGGGGSSGNFLVLGKP